ncbi:MAG: ECF transporter S component [Coprococcus phoceensis]
MKKLTVVQVCFIALSAVINIIGGNLALVLRLPIYLDSIGTFLASALLGPVGGVLAGVVSGVISASTDIYSLYFIPVQVVTGVAAGILFRTTLLKKWNIFLGAFCVSIAGTIISACITAYVFGGVTSSGSSILVTLLHKLGLNMVASAFVVQIVTDYADRLISIAIVVAVLAVLSNSMKQQIREGKTNGQV